MNEHEHNMLPENQAPSPAEAEPSSAWSGFTSDFFKVLLIAVLIIAPIRYFLFQPFVVHGESMEPNFADGDYLIIDELSYRLRDPARGEVVVLHPPNDPSQFFIKRIIGLPGERVLIRNGDVQIYNDVYPEGFIITEPYLVDVNITFGSVDIRLGSDEYYVLGDNRLQSSDSRVWGPVKEEAIVGRAYIRALPVGRINLFPTPEYY